MTVAYNIFFKRSVEKDFKTIPKRDLDRILDRIKKLAEDPRLSGSEKLTGQERYRVRQGLYCIVYSIQNNDLTIWVVRIGHQKDIYR
ncbi:MAG: type II toxin-antitoxin system RelE/ParE family toxin [Deltaproteobacteria bacterium]|nr:type II toxin-antitoxin system RelE/ParE family toxin [Deltaproteobacteria bacterium]